MELRLAIFFLTIVLDGTRKHCSAHRSIDCRQVRALDRSCDGRITVLAVTTSLMVTLGKLSICSGSSIVWLSSLFEVEDDISRSSSLFC